MNNEHPEQQALSDYALGKLDEQRAAAVGSHVADCPECEVTLQGIEGQADTLVSGLRGNQKSAAEDFAREEAYLRAIEQAANLPEVTAIHGQPTKISTPPPGAADENLAKKLGPYELIAKLGEGGMGAVYRAQHEHLGKTVAIKILPAAAMRDPALVGRFRREMKAVGALHHPNIVGAHDAGEAAGVHFLVMEYVAGKDLSTVLKEQGPLSVEQTISCTLQAARGLEFAHRKGIVHRDIKPANLLLDEEGVLKILDMGLARLDDNAHNLAAQEGLTQSGQVMGTVDYMAPEQAFDTHRADAKADVYSLGCTLYRLLTGQNAYAGDTIVQKILAHREKPIPSLRAARPEVPAALDQLFQRMLAKHADERIGMSDVVKELAALQSSTAPVTESVNLKQTPLATVLQPAVSGDGGIKKIPGVLLAAGFGAAAALVLLGIVFIIRDKDGKEIARVNGPDGSSVTVQQGTAPEKNPSTPTASPIKLKLSGPTTVPEGQEAKFQLELTNNSAAPLNAELQVEFDSGLENKLGTSPIKRETGDPILPGKMLVVNMPFTAVRHGEQSINITVTTPTGAPAQTRASLNVVAVPQTAEPNKTASNPADELAEWEKQTKALPAQQQLDAVSKKLIELNPNFDGKLTGGYDDAQPKIENNAVVSLGISAESVSDIRPVRVFANLKKLVMQGNFKIYKRSPLSDISPLAGMKLTTLDVYYCSIKELSVLRGMPLESLTIAENPVSDLSPLSGMRLKSIGMNASYKIKDLSVLRGMPLERLSANSISASDYSFLDGMKLKTISLHGTSFSDLKLLAGMPLEWADLGRTKIPDIMPLGDFTTLKKLELTQLKLNSADVAALQAKLPNCQILWDEPVAEPPVAAPQKFAFEQPDFAAWAAEVGRRDAETQRAMVIKKLQELNPGYDGEETHRIMNNSVVELVLPATKIADLSPVRALADLKILKVGGEESNRGLLKSLAPLQGLKLEKLEFYYTDVADLAPLRGMPLTGLICFATKVTDLGPLSGMPLSLLWIYQNPGITDLSPLRGAPLETLFAFNTGISDLTPLADSPLEILRCNGTPVSDLKPLRGKDIMRLEIAGTKVTDLAPLEKCGKLKRLEIQGLKIPAAEIEQLQKALPNCRITADQEKTTSPVEPAAKSQ